LDAQPEGQRSRYETIEDERAQVSGESAEAAAALIEETGGEVQEDVETEAGTTVNPAIEASREELGEAIEAARDTLDPDEQATYDLIVAEGATIEEAAKELGISEAMAKRRLKTIQTKMQRALKARGITGDSLASIERKFLPRQIGEYRTQDGEPISLADIRKRLGKALDIPIRHRGFRGAVGIFKQKAEVIRLKLINDIPTLAHEVGHYVHQLVFQGGSFAKRYDNELLDLGRETSKPSYSIGRVRKEGVAEFMRMWLTNPAEAYRAAPTFAEHFESYMMENHPNMYDALASSRDEIIAYIKQPALIKVGSMISSDPQKKGMDPRVAMQRAYDNWVDDLGPIRRAEKRLKEFGAPAELVGEASKLAVNYIGGHVGKAQHDLFYAQTDLKGDRVGESYKQIVKDVDNINDFEKYLVAKRVLELADRGIKTGIDRRDAQVIVDALGAKYEGAAKRLYKYQENLLNLLVESGLLSRKDADKMREMNKDYVPFYRVMEGLEAGGRGTGSGFTDLTSGIRQIKGSDRVLVSPLESIVKNTFMFRDLAERNQVGVAFFNLVEATPGGGRVADTIAQKLKPVKVSDEEMRSALRSAGVDEELAGQLLEDLDLTTVLFRAARNQSASDGIVTVWRKGKEQPYQLEDRELYRSLRLMDSTDAAVVSKIPGMKVFRYLTRLLRSGATLTFEFMARNPFRDQISAGVYSKHGFVPFFDGLRGSFSAIKRDDLFQEWQASGARFADFVSVDRTDLRTTLQDVLASDPSALRVALNLINPANIITNLQKMSEIMEAGTRIGEYRLARKAGLSKIEAANAAKDVTLNFSAGGFKAKLVNQVVAFFNASVRDVEKFAREHRERPISTMLKGIFYITIPSLLTWYLGKDDDDIQELPEWRKNYFWNVKIGGIVWSIPKPFLLGQIYGSSVERGLDFAYGKDPNAVKKWISGVTESMGIRPDALLPTGAKPMIETITNYSFFRERQLEPMGVQGLPVPERSTVGTSEAAKVLAGWISRAGLPEISPVKIDNLISGYTAGLGRYATDLADLAMDKAQFVNRAPEPAGSWKNIPVIRGFTKDDLRERSVYIDRLYAADERLEQIIRRFNDIPKQPTKADMRFYEKNKDVIRWANGFGRNPYNRILQDLKDYRKASRDVYKDPDMEPDAKREKLLKLVDAINEKSKRAYEMLPERLQKEAF